LSGNVVLVTREVVYILSKFVKRREREREREREGEKILAKIASKLLVTPRNFMMQNHGAYY